MKNKGKFEQIHPAEVLEMAARRFKCWNGSATATCDKNILEAH